MTTRVMRMRVPNDDARKGHPRSIEATRLINRAMDYGYNIVATRTEMDTTYEWVEDFGRGRGYDAIRR
jgi:hypothetical protein